MKKLKFLTLAAIAAATAMVSSCSDNGDLSTPTKEAEGKALVVNPTVLDSRVTPLAKGAFTGFKLYGVQNPNILNQSVGSFIKTGTTNGVDYSGTFGETAADVAFTSTTAVKWPTVYPSNSANFYAFSVQGGSDLTGSGITVNEDVNGWPDGTFSYTAPVDGDGNVDLSAQKDIMIASSLNAEQSTDNGVVTLPFKHAFAKLTFSIRWNAYEWIKNKNTEIGGTITKYARLYIKAIKIHNIKCNGTYSFTASDGNGGNGKWTVNGENSTIAFEFDNPKLFIASGNDATATKHFEEQNLLASDSTFMIVPQTLGLWSIESVPTEEAFTSNTTGAYVELIAFSYGTSDAGLQYKEEEGDDALGNYYETEDFLVDQDEDNGNQYFVSGFGGIDDNNKIYYESIYIPIRITKQVGENQYTYSAFVFEPNKSYNFRLNLAESKDDTGDKRLSTVEFK